MKLLTLDFETYYAADYSLSNRGMSTQRYVRDPRFKAHGCALKFDDGPIRWVTGALLPTVFARIPWDEVVLVCHNSTFDASILAWRYGYQPDRYIDTLALARAQIGACMPRHGLDYVSQELLGYGKIEGLANTRGIRDLSPELEAKLAPYCINDVRMTYGILPRLLKGMTRTELNAMDWTIRTFCNPKFVLDEEALSAYQQHLAETKQAALESVGMTDRETLNSSAKFAEALLKFGVDPPMKLSKTPNKDGSDKFIYAFAKTDDGLKALLDHEIPEVQALAAARLEIKSTNEEVKTAAYLASIEYGSWPVDLKYAGAMNTQRFSGGDGGGGNPQNLGQKSPIRRAITAPQGYKIMAADLSQIECRVTLQLASYYYSLTRMASDPETCREMEALDTLRNGGDIYCWFGSMIYGFPINKKDNPVERQVSKAAVLGLGFGMGWKRFLAHCHEKDVPMTEAMAKHIVTLYRKTFPNVVKSWKASLRQLENLMSDLCVPEFQRILSKDKAKVGDNLQPVLVPELDPLFHKIAVRMPNGQYIKYPDLTCTTSGRNAEWYYINRGKKNYIHPGKIFENYVQALAGLIMREMLVKIEHEMTTAAPDTLMGVELSVHDELVTLVLDDPDWLLWARDLLNTVMQAAPLWMPELPVACETKEGYCYADCH